MYTHTNIHAHTHTNSNIRLGAPEQALGGISLGFVIVVEGEPFELSCELVFN